MATRFGIGDKVWFKRSGSTPFVQGAAAASKTTYDSTLGGRGPSAVTFSKSKAGIGKEMGVPQIVDADLPTGVTTEDALTGTAPSTGLTVASIQSTANVTDGFANQNGNTLIFTVNGVTVTCTFSGSTTTVASVLTQVNAAIAAAGAPAVLSGASGGKLTLASTGKGTNASVSIGAGTSNTALNFVNSKVIQSSGNVTDGFANQNGNTLIFTVNGVTVTTTFSGSTTTVAGVISQVTTAIGTAGAQATLTGASGGKLSLTNTGTDPTTTTIGNGTSNATLLFTNATTTSSVIGSGSLAPSQAGTVNVGNFGVKSTTGKNHIGVVKVNGVYDGVTPDVLVNTGTVGGVTYDEGYIVPTANTIRTIDPNFPSGRPKALTSDGFAGLKDGPNVLAYDKIDQKTASKIAGKRVPSGEQGRGIVVDVVPVTVNGTKSPDGTALKAGDRMYWINWGPADPSNPHRVKTRRQTQRATLHAESDLVAG